MDYWYIWGPLFAGGGYLLLPRRFLPRRGQTLEEFTLELRAESDEHTGEIILRPGEVLVPHISALREAETLREQEILDAAVTGYALTSSKYEILPPIQLEYPQAPLRFPQPLVTRQALGPALEPELSELDLAMKALAGEKAAFEKFRKRERLEWDLLLADFERGMKSLTAIIS
jgi:hypothetical protein